MPARPLPLPLVFLLLLPAHTTASGCPAACNNNGACGADHVCACFATHRGASCAERVCPSAVTSWWAADPAAPGGTHGPAECAGAGTCDRLTGRCACFPGYAGGACERLDCPGASAAGLCSGHGVCRSMRQHAASAGPLAYAAPWDADAVWGCACDAPYAGFDCSRFACPAGDDPLTSGQVDAVQYVVCAALYAQQTVTVRAAGGALTGGTFALRAAEAFSRPLAHDASAADVEAALAALPNVAGAGGVTAVAAAAAADGPEWKVTFAADGALLAALYKQPAVQSLECVGDGGELTLRFAGGAADDTATVAWDASAAAVEAALEALPLVEDVAVAFADVATGGTAAAACSRGGTRVTVTFASTRFDVAQRGDVPPLEVAGTTVSVSPGVDGVKEPVVPPAFASRRVGVDTCARHEVQTLACKATSGTLALTLDGQAAAAPLAFDAPADALEAALEGLPNVHDVTVHYSVGTPYVVCCRAASNNSHPPHVPDCARCKAPTWRPSRT